MSLAKQWHGFGFLAEGKESEVDSALLIGPYPNRKSIALYEQKNGQKRPLAYFINEQTAFDAMCMLDDIAVITSYWGEPNDVEV